MLATASPSYCSYESNLSKQLLQYNIRVLIIIELDKKHLKNVGPIRHCEPPHAHSPDVATVTRRTVARRLRIDVHDNDDDDDNDNDNA